METGKVTASAKCGAYKMLCPKCKGRAFDIARPPTDVVVIKLKCPNCHRIVTVTIPKCKKVS